VGGDEPTGEPGGTEHDDVEVLHPATLTAGPADGPVQRSRPRMRGPDVAARRGERRSKARHGQTSRGERAARPPTWPHVGVTRARRARRGHTSGSPARARPEEVTHRGHPRAPGPRSSYIGVTRARQARRGHTSGSPTRARPEEVTRRGHPRAPRPTRSHIGVTRARRARGGHTSGSPARARPEEVTHLGHPHAPGPRRSHIGVTRARRRPTRSHVGTTGGPVGGGTPSSGRGCGPGGRSRRRWGGARALPSVDDEGGSTPQPARWTPRRATPAPPGRPEEHP